MNFVYSRTALAVLACVAGVWAGTLLGSLAGEPKWGGVVGGAAAIGLLTLVDGLRGRRLMHWLRGSQSGGAPRDAGFWGELGYRMERSLRLREKATQVERERLSDFLSAIEASPNGVLMLDAKDQIQWFNSVSADHFGLDPARDRDQRITNLVRSPAFVAYLQAGDYAEPLLFGAPRALSVLLRPYGDGQKLVLSQDVTERERVEGMRRDFVANVSHEIRTPLTVLAGFVETMATLDLTGAERKRVLALMAQQTDRMQALVGDLLTLAQLEGSPRPAHDRWVGMAQLARRAEADARALSADRHELVFDIGDEFDIAGNETELQSAVGNLLSNAIRYTPAGGRIQASWRRRPDGGAEIDVADTGPGIAREHLPRLTERFYRVDGSRSRETGGTGLGLAIVKHVVQRHGGEMDIESEPGHGSRFKLMFPPARVRQRAEAGAVA